VINAYQLAVMISLLPLASFGDIFGYRQVYRFGLVLYTSAALISAMAGSLEILTLGRALQGLGAAGIMRVSTALIRYTYPRRQLGRGIALTSLVVSTSSATGPTLAAAILSVALVAMAVRGQCADRHRHSGAVDAAAAAHRAKRPSLRPVERGIVRADVWQPDQRH
jgi:MFS family permease